jgi:hypothetical protein
MTTNTNTETATKNLNQLMDQRDQLVARTAKIVADRQAISYAALTGNDKATKEKLRRINDESVLHSAELESVDAALVEATKILNAAQRNEASVADREAAEALRIALSRFAELASILDDCIFDFVGAANEMDVTLGTIHSLGCPSPNVSQLRVLGTLAVKSFVMQIPWTKKEWEHLAPNERRTFKGLVTSWRAMIESNINARLGTEDKQERVA